MTEDGNIEAIAVIIIFIFVGAFAGSMITGCFQSSYYTKLLCQNFYTNTQDYIACLNKPITKIIKEIKE